MSEQLPETLRPDQEDAAARDDAVGDDDAAQKSPEVEFALVLSRMIEQTAANPARLRNAVYELARHKLRADTSSGAFAERRRLMKAFDTAVGGVETFYQRQETARASLPSSPSPELIAGPASGADTDDAEPLLIDHASRDIIVQKPQTVFSNVQPRRMSRPLLATGALALLAVAGLAWRFGVQGVTAPPVAAPTGAEIAAAPAAEAAPPAPPMRVEQPAPSPRAEQPAPRPDVIAPGIPMPSAYGVYAVSAGQLAQLNPLPGRVPDQRVFMSTAITQPSQTTIPDGRVQFVIFRRDLATNVADRMSVRVIARVKTDASTDTKRSSVATAEETWTVRSNAFDFRVSPVPGQPEMLTLLPDRDDLALTAGRYGLILKGQAYDFTVAGEITDPAQCLERMAAQNGTFYVECGANTGR